MMLRRRVLLERAAWQIQRGTSVTDAAFAAGYDSVEGFSRAFSRAYGHSPSALPAPDRAGHWLPAPNGIHFHSPTALYVDGTADQQVESAGDVMTLMSRHDLADIDVLLSAVDGMSSAEFGKTRLPRSQPRAWDGPDESIADVMWHLVVSKEPWLATISGEQMPDLTPQADSHGLRERHVATAALWLAMLRDIERRGAWALLCPPSTAGPLDAARRRRRHHFTSPRPRSHHVASTPHRRSPTMTSPAHTQYVYYTASTMDGFLADSNDSLDWLLTQPIDESGPFPISDLMAKTGAIVMGATTYQWVLDHTPGEPWPYPEQQTFVFSHRKFEKVHPSITVVSGQPAANRELLEKAAGDLGVWVVGGGGLAAAFAADGMLDEMVVSYAPVTLGAGRPLFDGAFDFELLETAQNRAFLIGRYRVVRARG